MKKTTKKLKPLFPIAPGVSKSKFSNNSNSSLRMCSNEPKVSVPKANQNKNALLIAKLLKLVRLNIFIFRTQITLGIEMIF
jgi:hypothetical protein